MDCEIFPLSCQVARVADAIGPHDADWWMVCISAGAALLSAFIAGVAVWNGQRATAIADASARIAEDSVSIAREAAERDEIRLEAEELRLAAEAQEKVALAMVRAFNAVDYTTSMGSDEARRADAKRHESPLVLEAVSLIDLYPFNGHNKELRTWFTLSINKLRALGESDLPEDSRFRAHLDMTLENTALWNRNVLTSSRLLETLAEDKVGRNSSEN